MKLGNRCSDLEDVLAFGETAQKLHHRLDSIRLARRPLRHISNLRANRTGVSLCADTRNRLKVDE